MTFGILYARDVHDIVFPENPAPFKIFPPFAKKSPKAGIKELVESKKFSVKKIALDKHQLKAFEMVETNKISMITGFAGTGKSSTVRVISDKLAIDGWNISRVAPTGKASKVIGGNTIHS